MARIPVFIVAIALGLAACGGPGSAEDPRLQAVRDGSLPADNLIIYDHGRRQTMGRQALGASGTFGTVGPTVVYVFRNFNPGDADNMAKQGIDAAENTAYLLPPGASPTLEAMQQMQEIGPIDPALTADEIASRFKLGEASPQTASAPAEQPEPAAATPAPADNDEQASGPSPAASEPAAADPAIAEMSKRLNEALADMARRRKTGDIREEDLERIAALREELNQMNASNAPDEAQTNTVNELIAAQVAALENARSDAAKVPPPAEASCAEYKKLDPKADETAAIKHAWFEYAVGFAGGLFDYGACERRDLDSAAYFEHLDTFCAANPELTIRDATRAFACPGNAGDGNNP